MQEPNKFVKTLHNELKDPIKGAIVTIAKQLKEEGMKSGVQQRMQQGMQKGARTALECLLEDKCNEIPDRYQEIIARSNPDNVLKWLRRILTSNNINDVFNG